MRSALATLGGRGEWWSELVEEHVEAGEDVDSWIGQVVYIGCLREYLTTSW